MELTAEEYIHEVIPSPGTEDKDWSAIEKKLITAKTFAKSMHVDIADGKLVSNTTFLEIPFSNEERHVRRIEKIKKIENESK